MYGFRTSPYYKIDPGNPFENVWSVNVGDNETYVFKSEDAMEGLAECFGIPVEDIRVGLNPDWNASNKIISFIDKNDDWGGAFKIYLTTSGKVPEDYKTLGISGDEDTDVMVILPVEDGSTIFLDPTLHDSGDYDWWVEMASYDDNDEELLLSIATDRIANTQTLWRLSFHEDDDIRKAAVSSMSREDVVDCLSDFVGEVLMGDRETSLLEDSVVKEIFEVLK